MGKNYDYFNRDLSWLHFNHRVLTEARDTSLPLYERIKFLAIYSNNLEEFYRVRVSYYRNLIRELDETHPKWKEVQPDVIIAKINELVAKYQLEFSKIFSQSIVPELRSNNIILLRTNATLTETQEAFVKKVFMNNVLSSLQPVLLKRKRIKPFLKTGQLYVVIKFVKRGLARIFSRSQVGMVKIPTDHNIARFITLPEENGNHFIMFLEDLIMRYIEKIFPGYKVVDWYNIKVTRDADLEYDDYVGEDLIDVIESIGSTRALGPPNRFQYDHRMPNAILSYLRDTLDLGNEDMVKGGSIHNFSAFFGFPNPLAPRLENDKLIPLRLRELDNCDSLIEEFQKHEYMLHFPYQSYSYFIRFLQEAANDPGVESIRSTQYRVASNSAVVENLITAAENGKKVTVFVELKARFDEEANLKHARDMKRAGIKIIYSIPGLKVHAKVALVTKKLGKRKKKSTAFIGTGNFNEKTARLYCDHGFFTSDDGIINDLDNLFKYLEDQSSKPSFKHILVPNFNMVETFERLIHQEIDHVKEGGRGYICLKMNGLEDEYMIDLLYEASEKGVEIDIIIRGICRLIPNQPYSKNIRLVRIIDKFLEHDRVFVFHNNGDELVYAGSADWMRRNLYRRVECIFPVRDESIKNEMIDILNIQLKDNVKARHINSKMGNSKIKREGEEIRSQEAIYSFLKKKSKHRKTDAKPEKHSAKETKNPS